MGVDIKYTEHYVAFIDVLGFKNLLYSNTSCQDIYSVFESLLNNCSTTFYYNCEDVKAFEQVKHYIMSDSIVLYIEADIEESFLALLGTCIHLQNSLLCRDNPILIRGGISKGPLFVDDRIIYGKALSDAYKIENSISVYPRVVFNKDLVIYAKEHNQSSKRKHWADMMVCIDNDELCYAHFFSLPLLKDVDEIPANFDKVLSACQLHLNSSYDVSIREKYIWLKNNIIKECELNGEFIKSLPNGSELFEKWKMNF